VIPGERDIRLEEVADPVLSIGGDVIIRLAAVHAECGPPVSEDRGWQDSISRTSR
jgi:hypothetical protein